MCRASADLSKSLSVGLGDRSCTLRRLCGGSLGGLLNKKHLKNVGPIRHNEPPHANSPDVARAPPAHRCPQRQRVTGDRYGPMEWAQLTCGRGPLVSK